jgi:hypothetical protein
MTLMLKDKCSEVRTGLGQNPKVPFSVLQRLVDDADTEVRYDLAENRHMPVVLLHRLMSDENPYVAQRAKQTLNSMYPAQIEFVSMIGGKIDVSSPGLRRTSSRA